MLQFSHKQLLSGLLFTLLISVLVPVSVEDNTIGGQVFSLLIIASLMTVLRLLTLKQRQ